MTHTCQSCGELFEARRGAKTCSNACRLRRSRRMRRASWAERQAARFPELGLEARDFWRSPPEVVAELGLEVGGWAFDAAASEADHIAPAYFDPEVDSLGRPWPAAPAFCNPPYGNTGPGRNLLAWVQHGAKQARALRAPVCLLVPATLEAAHIEAALHKGAAVEVIKGRLAFIDPARRRPVSGYRHASAAIWFGTLKPPGISYRKRPARWVRAWLASNVPGWYEIHPRYQVDIASQVITLGRPPVDGWLPEWPEGLSFQLHRSELRQRSA